MFSLELCYGQIKLGVQPLHVLCPALVNARHVCFVFAPIEAVLQPGTLLIQLFRESLLHLFHVPSVLLHARLRLLIRLSGVLVTGHNLFICARTGRVILHPVEVQLCLGHIGHQPLELGKCVGSRFHSFKYHARW